MSIGMTVAKMIETDVTVVSYVADRIYPLVYPSMADFPCITYRIIASYHEPVMCEEVMTSRVQLDIWSFSYDDTAAIKSALTSLFNYFSGTANFQNIQETRVDLAFDIFEQNIKAHRAVVDVRITHDGD
jgi:hypothetical protein